MPSGDSAQTPGGQGVPPACNGNVNGVAMYRVLRAEECVASATLSPASPLSPSERAPQRIVEICEEHVLRGSSAGYKSQCLSFSTSLQVAFAFAAGILRIAVACPQALNPADYVVLAEINDQFESQEARDRSARSHEVLMFTSLSPGQYNILDVTPRVTGRSLAPDFERADSSLFPTMERLEAAVQSGQLNVERLASANKRFFRVQVGGRHYVCRTPRPNVSSSDPMLCGEDLVRLAAHEFTCMACYRRVCPSRVPRCALYELSCACPLTHQPVRWAILLFEDFQLGADVSEHAQLMETAQALLPWDTLFANWNSAGKAQSLKELGSKAEALYGWIGRPGDRRCVRIDVSRAFGCTYPEDLDKSKATVPLASSILALCGVHAKQHAWLYGDLPLRLFAASAASTHDMLVLLDRTLLTFRTLSRDEWPLSLPQAVEYQGSNGLTPAQALTGRMQEYVHWWVWGGVPVRPVEILAGQCTVFAHLRPAGHMQSPAGLALGLDVLDGCAGRPGRATMPGAPVPWAAKQCEGVVATAGAHSARYIIAGHLSPHAVSVECWNGTGCWSWLTCSRPGLRCRHGFMLYCDSFIDTMQGFLLI